MSHLNERAGSSAQAPRVTVELRRAAWVRAAALIAIVLTVAALSLFDGGPRIHWLAAVTICAEIILVLVATSWLTRQNIAHARRLEDQESRLLRQASELNAAVAEARRTTALAEAETRHKARLVALLDAALSSSPVGFGFFDTDLRFLRVNAALARINGRPPEEHIGATLQDIDPLVAADVEPLLRRVLATRQAVSNVEFEGATPGTGGQSRSWLTGVYPIITADGELYGVGIAVTDVTEVKQLEEQLQQAQKMEAVGRLAGGVAHDFNNLLTVINSYAELILFDPELSKGHEEVEEIRGATARAAKLTRQLLAFSRRQALEPRILNPNDVLRGVESLLRRLVDGSVTIVTNLAAETPVIRVDPGQLEQVIMNLAINAADAMQEGGRLVIETQPVTVTEAQARRDLGFAPGEYARIRVSDTGHGMDADIQAQIFEPFFTTKEPGRGTGLGLSTVYGIVKQSGGHVEVTSAPGEGSVFTLYLPAVGAADDAPR